MIDSCYDDFDFHDVLKTLGVNEKDGVMVGKVKQFVDNLFERKVINWKVTPDNIIFKRTSLKPVFNPESVIGDMITFIQNSERIY